MLIALKIYLIRQLDFFWGAGGRLTIDLHFMTIILDYPCEKIYK